MADRIKQQDVDNMVHRINKAINGEAGDSVWHEQRVGFFTLSGAFGGLQLQQNVAEESVRDVSNGHVSKREMYTFLRGMLAGIEAQTKGERND